MPETWLDRVKRRFELTFHPTRLIAGVCESYTLTQARSLFEHASSITDRAKTAGAFAKYANVLGDAGSRYADAVKMIDDYAQKGNSVMVDTTSACEISDAIATLNRWTLDKTTVSNQQAAKAFDKLFGGTSTFFQKLPPPFNAYASVFANIAAFNFFSHMQDLLDPESPNTPRGRQLREIMKNI